MKAPKPPNLPKPPPINKFAVANFSQKQIRDAKTVTGKLVDGLRFLKDAAVKNTTISDLDERANEVHFLLQTNQPTIHSFDVLI